MKTTKLPEFKTGMDSRCRDYSTPTVARFWVSPSEMRFAVVGTAYGHIHTIGGNVRTWKSYSGARRAARNYVAL